MAAIRERKNKKGKIIYHAEIRRKGRSAICKSFNRLTDAKAWIQETETNLRTGRYVPQAAAQRHRVSEAIQRYINEELPKKPKSYVNQKRELLWFESEIGSSLLSEISPSVLNEVKRKFLKEEYREGVTRKPQSWNRYIAPLSCVFQMCVGDWEWMEYNPARRIKREKEAPGRVRFSDRERIAFS